MIKVDRILKQSWRILWSYRVLWIFGLLLALTGGGGGSNPNFNFNDGKVPSSQPSTVNLPAWAQQFGQWFQENVNPLFEHPENYISTFIWIGLTLLLIVMVIGLLAAVVRYPVETAIIRLVDDYEQTGTRLGFRAGWRLGWTRRAFRAWVIDLITGLPALVIVLILMTIGLLIYSNVTAADRQMTNILGSLAAIGVFVLVLLAFIVLMVFLSLLRNFFIRAAALENLGVIDSLRSGWALFRGQWKNAGLIWLVMIGIGLLFGVVTMVLFFILIPAYLVLLIPAGIIAAVPGVVAYGISNLFTSGPLVWIITVLAAVPFFFIVLFSPLIFFGGWYRIFESNVWTLTYREIKPLQVPPLPQATAGNGPV